MRRTYPRRWAPVALTGLLFVLLALHLLLPASPLTNLLQRVWANAQAAQRGPQTKPDFDIRANLQRTLNDPADAEINVPLAAPDGNPQSALRKSALPFALRRAHPSVQMKWSSLTQAPSRVWSFNELLSGPSADDAEVIARRFVRDNEDLLGLNQADQAALRVARRYQDAHNGLTHLTLQQQFDGIDVFHGELTLHIARGGEVVALNNEAMPDGAALTNARAPQMPAAKALRLAAEDAEAPLSGALTLKNQPTGAAQNQLFDQAETFGRDVEAKLVYFPLTNRQVRLAWQFVMWMKTTPDVYLTMIDAEKGTVLYRFNLTNYDENPLKPHGQVFTKDAPVYSVPYTTAPPTVAQREDLPFRAAGFNGGDIFPVSDPHYDWWAAKTANGLISNNTDTHLDRDANNQADLPRLTAADGNFSFPLDLTKAPTDPDYQKAAQVNLFYWVNRYHDILYSYGFTEAAGNFQTDNFSRGGRGNDAVQADAQDGSGTNNANFSTPLDGSAGRVQMYLWTTTNPQRDGDFDQGVVVHELTHGLSNRLVGNATGLSGNQSRGMGEGWSDYFGLVLLRDEKDDLNGIYAVGQYVTNNYTRGIRRFPYGTSTSIYPLTFKDIALSTQVHNIGEIWCNTLLEMRASLIQRYGFKEGQRQSIQLVVDGLKLSPNAPSFLDARNAILLADRVNNGGANQCLLWQSFSKRGMGFDAETPDANDGAPVEALNIAPYCSTLGILRTDKPNYLSGETLKLNLGDANATGALTAVLSTTITGDREVVTLRADTNLRGSYDTQIRVSGGRVQQGDGQLQGSVDAGDEIVVTYNDANNGAGSGVVRLTLPIAREKVTFDDTIESGNQGWLPSGTWTIVNTRGASPARSWTESPAGNYLNNQDMSLVSPQFDFSGLNNITLTFAQSYDVEEGFDFGALEFSTDDGQSWRRAAATTGVQSDFRQAQVRLKGLDNQPRARLRFRFVSDTSVIGDGWYVDDIRLTGRSVSPNIIAPGTRLDPTLTALVPAFGLPAGGTRVTLYGSNFTEAEDTTVTFDGVPATGVTLVSNGVLSVIAPAHPVGVAQVRITNRNGSAVLGNGFTYYTAGSATNRPEIENVLPNFGALRGGTTVTVIGKGFTPETTVRFSNAAARVTFVNSTTLRAISPAATAAGAADVTVANGMQAHNRPSAFNYVNPTPPSVDVIAPDGGETVFAGSTLDVRWNSNDNSNLANHRVSLFRPGTVGVGFVRDLGVNLPGNTRIFNWPVPFDLTPGEYRIRVIATDDEGVETEAYSTNSFALTRRWATAQPLPTPVSQGSAASDGRYIYNIGGRPVINGAFTTSNQVLRWDTTGTASWTAMAPLPEALYGTDAVFLKGKIYAPGGVNAANSVVGQHSVYDPATNTWARTVANVPSVAAFHALVPDTTAGVYYLTGGFGPNPTALRSFNPDTNTWTTLPSMATGRYQHEAALIEGKLYVAGGQAFNGASNLGGTVTAEVYDFSTRTWSSIAPLNRPRQFGANFVTRDVAGNPIWVLVGGVEPNTGELLGAEVYDVRRNRWIILDNSFSLPTPRTNVTGVTVDPFFYVLGSSNAGTGVANERIRLDNFAPVPLDVAAPSLAVPETLTAVPGAELQFTVTASDLGSGLPLSLTAVNLPNGATFATTAGSNNGTRGTFRWTPTAADAGRSFTVNFAVTDGQLSDVKLVNIRVVTARPLAAVNAADFRSGTLAADSIASIFGTELAVRTEAATEQPLPFELSGTTVTINGLRAPLFFVSASQINFIVPALLQPGPATIVVTTPAGTVSAGTVRIAAATPALFTRDQTGRGEAFAVATDGVNFQVPPFDVVVNSRPNVLVLFGTGFRRANVPNATDDNGVAEVVAATIGGRPARVLFAGPQGGFAGLDQINIEFPASLAGGGTRSVEVVLNVNGEAANRVTIPLK